MDLIDKLILNPDNPRKISKQELENLQNSIKIFAKMLEVRPIAYDEKFMVWGGNQRLTALKLLKNKGFEIKDSYFKELKGFTEEEKKQFAIKDNELWGVWDNSILQNKWSSLPLTDWGLPQEQWDKNYLREMYSKNKGEVIYKPKQTNHKISDLFKKETKFDDEINNLKNEELKDLLRSRVAFFHEYNFANIADYYAYQATPEEQRIIEKLALVILDKNQLIENGFSKIIESLEDEKEIKEDELQS